MKMDAKAIKEEVRRRKRRARSLKLQEKTWKLYDLLISEIDKKQRRVDFMMSGLACSIDAEIRQVTIEDFEKGDLKEDWASVTLSVASECVFEFDVFNCFVRTRTFGDAKRFLESEWVELLAVAITEAENRRLARARDQFRKIEESELLDLMQRFGIDQEA